MPSYSDPGYRIVPGLYGPAELDGLLSALSQAALPRGRAGARHLLRHPDVAAVACDPRLCSLAREILGGNAFPFRATLFDKSASANWLVAWHQDTALPLRTRSAAAGWGPWSVKAGVLYAHAPAAALEHVVALRLHLDDSTADNGPLRVLPGTHALGVLSDDEIAAAAARVPAVPCLVPRGGVLAMRPLILHASSKSLCAQPRRVLHFEYANTSVFPHGLQLAAA